MVLKMEIALNKCYGGFAPSMLAYREYLKQKGKKSFFYKQTKYGFKEGKEEYERIKDISVTDTLCFYCYTKDLGKIIKKLPSRGMIYLRDDKLRKDKDFITVVKKLKKKVNSYYSKIKIVTIPDDMEWTIEDYDGIETLHEKHRSW
jgi:hypothetical protein